MVAAMMDTLEDVTAQIASEEQHLTGQQEEMRYLKDRISDTKAHLEHLRSRRTRLELEAKRDKMDEALRGGTP